MIFLTADHGVVSEPHKLQELNIPSGYYSSLEMKDELADSSKRSLKLARK